MVEIWREKIQIFSRSYLQSWITGIMVVAVGVIFLIGCDNGKSAADTTPARAVPTVSDPSRPPMLDGSVPTGDYEFDNLVKRLVAPMDKGMGTVIPQGKELQIHGIGEFVPGKGFWAKMARPFTFQDYACAQIINSEVGWVPSDDWWMAVDVTMGFDSGTRFESPAAPTHDIILAYDEMNAWTCAISPPKANSAMNEPNGPVLKYANFENSEDMFEFFFNNYASDSWLNTDPGEVPFVTGQRLRFVISYTAASGTDLYIYDGKGDVIHKSRDDTVPTHIRNPETVHIALSWQVVPELCFWWGGGDTDGDYSNYSYHRNFIIANGKINDKAVYDYLTDTDNFVRQFIAY